MYTLQNTINWCSAFVEGSPLTAWPGGEPATSTAAMIRNSILNPPLTWSWNRFEDQSVATVLPVNGVGQQDYTVPLTNFGFLEKVSVQSASGAIFELNDIYNASALSQTNGLARPNAVAVIANTPGTSIKIRFMSVPDTAYKVTLTYQGASNIFGPFTITSVGNAVAGNTTYTGSFSPLSFPVGGIAVITGCTTAANNGSFIIVSVTATILVVANAAGVAETETAAFVGNFNWAPIPDQYSDVYNNLFLAEAFAAVDDARSQVYRSRGVAALLSKAEGLNEMQRNAIMQQWLAGTVEAQASALRLQQSIQARGV